MRIRRYTGSYTRTMLIRGQMRRNSKLMSTHSIPGIFPVSLIINLKNRNKALMKAFKSYIRHRCFLLPRGTCSLTKSTGLTLANTRTSMTPLHTFLHWRKTSKCSIVGWLIMLWSWLLKISGCRRKSRVWLSKIICCSRKNQNCSIN